MPLPNIKQRVLQTPSAWLQQQCAPQSRRGVCTEAERGGKEQEEEVEKEDGTEGAEKEEGGGGH
eukprot:1710441-Rhodomonas_salina.4